MKIKITIAAHLANLKFFVLHFEADDFLSHFSSTGLNHVMMIKFCGAEIPDVASDKIRDKSHWTIDNTRNKLRMEASG